MRLEKISILVIGIIIFAGSSSFIPFSYGGSEFLCYDGNGVIVSCTDPTCFRGECISDPDGDNIPTPEDNCPFISNPLQDDTDENGIGDACQDVDGDEVLDTEDNCPFISNPLQDDTDENGIGDACQEQIKLLVQATFPPGDTISVELPEDPETGVFSISLKLPDTQGGEVLIETTDAGDTPANFSFLGNIIDFNAPCSDNCEISFTFTQELLDEQGITLDQVTIFHDMNENGSFEADEAIPTVVTGDGPFTATANASFTSKFSVGGIKALALGALAGGGGSSGGNPPSLENLSFDGVKTKHEDGTIGFGGLIFDEISSINNFPTQTIETNVPFELRFPFYEDNGARAIAHVGVYILRDDDKNVSDSELYLVYDTQKPLKIYDPHGYVSNFTVDIKEKSAFDVDIIFEITFVTPMDSSDVIVRVWDNFRRSNDYLFKDLIQVVGSEIELTLEESSDENSKSMSAINDSETISNEIHIEIPMWIKYNADWWSQKEISDDDFIAGIKYLIEDDIIIIPNTIQEKNNEITEIPEWIRSSAGWWADDLLSDKEFVQSIQWIIKEGIMTI